MDVAVACFPAKWYAPLHRVAKEITGSLGEVRDRDVMIESLAKARKKAPANERPGIDHLIARLERERDTARADMVRYLDDLMTGDVPHEVEARFGPEAAPANENKDAA
jgi:CHAD domain-containing protein